MTQQRCIDPSSSDMYQSEQLADVTATAVQLKVLSADGNRIAFWVAINGAVTLVAPNMISVGTLRNGVFTCFGTISTNEGDAYYSILRYGSLVQGDIYVRSSTNNQNISVGYLTRPYREA